MLDLLAALGALYGGTIAVWSFGLCCATYLQRKGVI